MPSHRAFDVRHREQRFQQTVDRLVSFQLSQGLAAKSYPSSDSDDSDYSPEKKASFTGFDSEDSADLADDLRAHSSVRKKSSRRLNSNNSAKSSHKSSRKRTQKQASHKGTVKRLKTVADNDQNGVPNTSGSKRTEDQSRNECSAPSVFFPSNASVPSLPSELWLKIFQHHVDAFGPLPFLNRASRVSRTWCQLATEPSLWKKVDLSFGWIKSKDETLKWLAENRLSQCRELSLFGWKNVTNDAMKELCGKCPHLEVVNISHCSKLTSVTVAALVSGCPNIRELDLSFTSSDAVSYRPLKQAAETLGTSLTSLSIAGNHLTGFNQVLNAIMANCFNLDTLDLSNCRFSTDFFILHVEKLQASCPSLRVLRLANCKIRGKEVSQNVQAQATGFVKLEQLSCAMPILNTSFVTPNGVPDNLLARLLHKAENLQLLDLRGCTRFSTETLLSAQARHVEELYLAQSSISQYSDALAELFMKWRHSLIVIDLSWTSFEEEHLYDAIKVLTQLPTCGVTHLNLAGTIVTLPTVRLALTQLTRLNSLDLTSCRALPRGIKSLHEGPAALRKLRDNLQKLNSGSDSDTDDYDL